MIGAQYSRFSGVAAFSLSAISLLLSINVSAADYSTKEQAKFRADHATKSADCATVAHQPAPNVAYDGKAANDGWAGVPADVSPPAVTSDDIGMVDIPLNLPLRDYTAGRRGRNGVAPQRQERRSPNAPYSANLSESWIQPGHLSVDTKSGEAQLNGKPLHTLEPAQLNPDCWDNNAD